VLACGVGLLVTLPIGVAALLYAYEDIFAAARKSIPAAGPSGTVVLGPRPAASPFGTGLSKPVIAGLTAATVFLVVVAVYGLARPRQHIRHFVPRPQVVLAEPPEVEQPVAEDTSAPEEKAIRADFELRLKAATNMSWGSERDTALADVAKTAAGAGEGEIAKRAVQGMLHGSSQDEIRRECAIELTKHGKRKQAIEIATGMMIGNLRDATLAELAKGTDSLNRQ
jgi:hypothetical protein